MKDLILLDEYDHELKFEIIDRTCFQIWVRQKNQSFIIQPTLEDAIKIRDWLASLIVEYKE